MTTVGKYVTLQLQQIKVDIFIFKMRVLHVLFDFLDLKD